MNSETKVGAFTLVGATILAGMISFMGGFKFSNDVYGLTITYSDAQGIIEGAEVRYAGVHVGKVKDIRVVDNRAAVQVEIDKNIHFPVGVNFSISADGVMGEKFVNIIPPNELVKSFVAADSVVEGSTGGSVDDFLAQSTEMLVKVEKIVDNLDKMLMNETIQKSINAGAVNLTKITENLRNVTAHLQGITGVIDGVAQEPESAKALRETISNVRDTSAGTKKLVSTISDVEVDVDAGHNVKGGHWRGNMGVTLTPSKNNYIYIGGYDIGDSNKFDFLVGSKFGPTGISVGSMQGEFGVGLSYDVIKMFKLYSQLYDFDNHKVRIGGEIKLNDNISIYGETMDICHGTRKETFAGVRARF